MSKIKSQFHVGLTDLMRKFKNNNDYNEIK